jgi:hypothetical protein
LIKYKRKNIIAGLEAITIITNYEILKPKNTHIYDHMPRTDISIKCGGVKLVVLLCPHLPSS